jgi:hypothetical protein
VKGLVKFAPVPPLHPLPEEPVHLPDRSNWTVVRFFELSACAGALLANWDRRLSRSPKGQLSAPAALTDMQRTPSGTCFQPAAVANDGWRDLGLMRSASLPANLPIMYRVRDGRHGSGSRLCRQQALDNLVGYTTQSAHSCRYFEDDRNPDVGQTTTKKRRRTATRAGDDGYDGRRDRRVDIDAKNDRKHRNDKDSAGHSECSAKRTSCQGGYVQSYKPARPR